MYMVTEGESSGYRVIAVFTDRERAEQFVVYQSAKQGYVSVRVEEVDLDPGFTPINHITGFLCYQEAPRALISVETTPSWDKGTEEVQEDPGNRNHESLYVKVNAKSVAAARKIAAEKFAQYRAEKAGVA